MDDSLMSVGILYVTSSIPDSDTSSIKCPALEGSVIFRSGINISLSLAAAIEESLVFCWFAVSNLKSMSWSIAVLFFWIPMSKLLVDEIQSLQIQFSLHKPGI